MSGRKGYGLQVKKKKSGQGWFPWKGRHDLYINIQTAVQQQNQLSGNLEDGQWKQQVPRPWGRSIPEEQVPVQGLSSRTVTWTGLSNENKHKQCYDYGCSLTDKCDATHRSWNSSLCTHQVVEEAGTLPQISEHDLWAIGWDLLGCEPVRWLGKEGVIK